MECGKNNQIIIIIANVVIIGILLMFLIIDYKNISKALKIICIMIISGGTSNLIDRVFRGYVIDYIDTNKIFNYPVFNIADISVVIGVILLICYIIVKNNNRQENS